MSRKAKSPDNWYPEKKAAFSSPGPFVAFIAGTDEVSDHCSWSGISACALQVKRAGAELGALEDVAFSDEAESDESRALAAAAVAVAESLPGESSVTIHSRAEYVVKTINEWLEQWKANGWRRSNGQPPKHKEIWQRFDKVKNERKLRIRAVHCSKKSKKFAEIFDSLQEGARKARDERAKQLGTATQGFEEVLGGYVDPTHKSKRERKKPKQT